LVSYRVISIILIASEKNYFKYKLKTSLIIYKNRQKGIGNSQTKNRQSDGFLVE